MVIKFSDYDRAECDVCGRAIPGLKRPEPQYCSHKCGRAAQPDKVVTSR